VFFFVLTIGYSLEPRSGCAFRNFMGPKIPCYTGGTTARQLTNQSVFSKSTKRADVSCIFSFFHRREVFSCQREDMATPAKVRFCSLCNASKLWHDDSHDICFKCRGKDHQCDTCEDCPNMGTLASHMWSEFVQASPAPKRYVSSNEFEAFQQRMEQAMRANNDLLQKLTQISTQPQAGASCSAALGSGPQAGDHQDPQCDIDIDRDSGDDFSSEVSTGNFKRRSRSVLEYSSPMSFPVVHPEDSVSNHGSAEASSHGMAPDSDYQEVITELINTLSIDDALIRESAEADITSTRVSSKRAKIYLPLAQSHKDIIDSIWDRDNSTVNVFKHSVTERYHITEKDFEKYCKVGSLDKILSHALRRSGVTTSSNKGKSDSLPKLPNPDSAKLEAKAWRIERQS